MKMHGKWHIWCAVTVVMMLPAMRFDVIDDIKKWINYDVETVF